MSRFARAGAAFTALVGLGTPVTTAGAGVPAPTVQVGARAAVTVTPVGAAGSGTPFGSRAGELAGAGYEEAEYFVSGVAQLYSGSSAGPPTPTDAVAQYTTRILVRAPRSRAAFSGRVVVEPFNTSAGRESDAAWGMIGARLVENGDAWIGVTVRNSAVAHLKTADADRYAALDVESNGVAWDTLTALARLVRAKRERNPLHPLPVERVYLTGYSQSAVDAVTYANAFNPLGKRPGGGYLYDGYLVMGRAASATPLDSGTAVVPRFEIRPTGRATSPIVEVQSQSDVEGFATPAYTNPGGATVRRADRDASRDRYRLYEIPGSAHAPRIPSCDHDGTTFPLRYFERAALENLYAWAERGKPPPRAARIETTRVDTVSTFALDENGNALGGVRSPFVDHALARYDGSDTPGPLCALAGFEVPLEPATLVARYGDVAGYLRAFAASLDDAIGKRLLLRADLVRILDETRSKAEHAFGGT